MNIKEIKKELFKIEEILADLGELIDDMEQEEKPLLTDKEKEILKFKIKELEKVTGHEYYAISLCNQPIPYIRFYHTWYEDYYDTVTGFLGSASSLDVNVKYHLDDLGVK